MTDTHSQSFFGQSTGLTIQTISNEEPFIFFKCIKKKANGIWEKPSNGEGKVIKCNLEEIIMILQVLNQNIRSWFTFHSFNETKTQICFKWEEEKDKKLWVNIGSYSKMLNFAQIEIFRLLLKHILKEKIEFATKSSINQSTLKFTKKNPPETSNSEIPSTQTDYTNRNKKSNSQSQMSGTIIKETDHALLIKFSNGKEIWIPKSIIKSQYDSHKGILQSFFIDTWFLKKNNVSTI